jgi:hypothetical protein
LSLASFPPWHRYRLPDWPALKTPEIKVSQIQDFPDFGFLNPKPHAMVKRTAADQPQLQTTCGFPANFGPKPAFNMGSSLLPILLKMPCDK